MLPAPLLTLPLNHLLGQTPGAAERLKAYQRQGLCIQFPPLSLSLLITDAGYFAAADGPLNDSVSITFPADTPVLLLLQPEALKSRITVLGPAEFVATLGEVFSVLRWDAESDLARLTGDIAAVRLVRLIKDVLTNQLRSARNLSANLQEYLLEETALLIRQAELPSLCSAADELEHRLETLMARVQTLG